MEKYSYQQIPINQINADGRFQTRFVPEQDRLDYSVKERGIVIPLLAAAAHPLQLLDGYGRYRAAKKNGLEKIGVWILKDALPDAELFVLALMANWKTSWTDADRVWVIRKAKTEFGIPEEKGIQEILPLLGLRPQKRVWDAYGAVGGSSSLMLPLMGEGRLPLAAVQILCELAPNDQVTFLSEILRPLHLSFSQTLLAVEWIRDILRSKKIRLDLWLHGEPEILKILRDLGEDRRQISDEFMETLKCLRFPKLSERQAWAKQWEGKILEQNKGLRIQYPSSFEEEGFELAYRIRGPESLDEMLDVLREKRTILNTFFDFMI